jgi:murein hydrolase activator
MWRKHSFCLFLCISCSLAVSLFAQTNKKDLQKKKEQLRKDIEFTNRLLNDTKEKKSISIGQLVTLNKKITIREELINTINDEIVDLNHQIAQINIQIEGLSRELTQLKEEYSRMIVYAYKNQGAYKRLVFLFASSDFNQAYKRMKYLQQYGNYRKKQAQLIQSKQGELSVKIEELVSKKSSKKDLLSREQLEKRELDSEKTQQWTLLQSLQEKEKVLRQELKKKQKAEEAMNRAIEDLVKKEIEEARKKAEAAGKKNVTKGNVFMDPGNQKLSSNFESNRGKLPWPVEQGVITSTFGVHPHPALKGILLNNNGIDINSSRGATARAIFEGQVTGVVSIPGAYKSIIVRHGDYRSVYSNLEEVFVKMGDKVTTRQDIGRIHTDESDNRTEINLQIWKGETRLDPAGWISTKK